MWKHFIFLITILLVSFKNLDAGSLVSKSDSRQTEIYSLKSNSQTYQFLQSIYQKINQCHLDPLFPSLQSVGEMDTEYNQYALTDRWMLIVHLSVKKPFPIISQAKYCSNYVLDLAPIPIPYFSSF